MDGKLYGYMIILNESTCTRLRPFITCHQLNRSTNLSQLTTKPNSVAVIKRQQAPAATATATSSRSSGSNSAQQANTIAKSKRETKQHWHKHFQYSHIPKCCWRSRLLSISFSVFVSANSLSNCCTCCMHFKFELKGAFEMCVIVHATSSTHN